MKKFQTKKCLLATLMVCCTVLSLLNAGPRSGGSRGGGHSSSRGGSGRTHSNFQRSSRPTSSSSRISPASLQERRQNFIASQRMTSARTRPSSTPATAAGTRPSNTSNIVPKSSARTIRTSPTTVTRTSRTHPRSGHNRYYGHRRYYGGYWGWPYYDRYFWYVGTPCWADEWIFWYPRSCFFYGYPYYPRISANIDESRSSDDSSGYSDDIESRKNRYPVLVQTLKIEENPVVMIQLPAVNQSQYHNEHGNYGGYYALYAASKLQRTNPTTFSETVIGLSQTQEKLFAMAKRSGLMDRSKFSDFLKKAVDLANRFDDQDKKRLQLQLRKFAAPSEDQLQAVGHEMKELSKITIGYDSLPQDIKQVADLITNVAQSAQENEKPQFYCLTSRRGSDDWVAVRIEKKRGVTYATIVDAMGTSRIMPSAH